jgi:hypothetical protein
MNIERGSRWQGQDHFFRVIDIVDIDGQLWVHYIKENSTDDVNREYSCFVESFLSRFREAPND